MTQIIERVRFNPIASFSPFWCPVCFAGFVLGWLGWGGGCCCGIITERDGREQNTEHRTQYREQRIEYRMKKCTHSQAAQDTQHTQDTLFSLSPPPLSSPSTHSLLTLHTIAAGCAWCGVRTEKRFRTHTSSSTTSSNSSTTSSSRHRRTGAREQFFMLNRTE